jgi:phage tail-like protein
MAVINNRSTLATDPIRNFRFLVTFKPQTGVKAANGGDAGSQWATDLQNITFGFTSVSGMAVSTDSIPYREGGYNTTVHQIPGQTSFAPLTMQRGVVLGTSQNWNWMRELFQTVQGNVTRTTADNFRCDIQIDVLSHPIASTLTAGTSGQSYTDHVSMRFNVYNAWITSIAYSDLNAGDNAILVEQMGMVHEGFDVTWGTDLTDAGSAAVIDDAKATPKSVATGGTNAQKAI